MGRACRLHGQLDLRIDEVIDDPLGSTQVRVHITRGGICGSDLHYFMNGGFGPVRVMEPIILGHEIAGIVSDIGSDVAKLSVGDKVAVSPSQPCHACAFCNNGEFQHCKHMQFLGSARTMPHVQGGFRESLAIDSDQCFRISSNTGLERAACAEPLAVCLHAAEQAGNLKEKRVLVTGAGPIGALCVAVSNYFKAKEIVVTDLFDFPLNIAKSMGPARGVNVSLPDATCRFGDDFDIVFECSAAESAIAMAIQKVRPRGTIVQVGVTGSLTIPINAIVGKEIIFKGTHRFHPEFAEAVRLIDQNHIDVMPLVTHIFDLSEVHTAFAIASDRTKAIKVQLAFDER